MKVDGTWRTVLVVGGGEGGASYFALDITEPTAPSVMWQVTLPNGKSSASEVEFAVVGDVPYAMIGSGLDETTGEAYMYVYAMEDGQLEGELLLSNDVTVRNKATAPRGVDLDLDGETDVVYIGDLQGHLWRMATDAAGPNSWEQTLLFACDQPLTARPVPAFGEENRIYVYEGTGAYLTPDDIGTTDQNSFYCVYDSHDGGTHTRFDLVDQTSTIEDVGSADGWFVDLWNGPGERVTEPAVVAAGNVYFTAYAPSTEACTAGGSSWLYRMHYDDGSEVENEEEEGEHYPRSQALDEGVASRPVVDIVNESVIVQSSDATITVEQMGTTFFHLTVRSWQENYEPEENSSTQTPLQ
jgi:type IV pilus assembly protein PilY1